MKQMTGKAVYVVRKTQELEVRRAATANVVLGYLLSFHGEDRSEEDQ
jgi:hypothetical protein